MIARVLPDLPAVDRPFDYLVPDDVRDQVRVGSLVRIELHGRRVGGWVVDLGDDSSSEVAPEKLKPIAKLSSDGPPHAGSWTPHELSGRDGVKHDLIALVDLDADGDLDVITTEEVHNLGVIWYENPGKVP